jgi:hypothetical protein
MKIQQELDTIKSNYNKTIDRVEGLKFSQKKLIRMIEFYKDSKYLNGQKDELMREKPFYNILNGISDMENAAKDLDTKDITVTSDDPNHYLEAFLLSKDIQVWMKEVNFGKTLNDIRNTDTDYGSVLVKKCYEIYEDSDKRTLKIELPDWKNVITDQVSLLDGAIVEEQFMTAPELAKMSEWDTKAVNSVLDKLATMGSGKRVPVYELRGKFSQATYKQVESEKDNVPYKATAKDKRTYTNQLYYVAGDPVENARQPFNVDTLTVLYCEDNTEEVYKYKTRKRRAGRAFGVGVYEEGEEAQVWTNDTVLKQFRAMEYTTKVIMQTASKKLKGRNVLTEMDDGTTLEHEDDKPVTRVELLPSGGLQQYQNLITQWNTQLEKATSSYAAQRGETPPSGTPYRLQQVVLNQSESVFINLLEDMGIFVGEIFNDWIMPYLASRMNREHILAYEFSAEELKEIDKNFSIKNANDKAAELMLQGKIVTQEQYDAFLQSAESFIKSTKGQRFIQIPKNFYKNLKAKVTINITGEQKNKAAILESLNSVMTVYMNAKKAGLDLSKDPVFSLLLNSVIEISGSGISPVMINSAISEQATQQAREQQTIAQQQPQQAPQPAPLSLATNPQ